MTAPRLSVWMMVLGFSAALAAEIPAEIPWGARRSGTAFMGRENQAMQADDVANPGMLWVLDGEEAWDRAEGAAGKSCADCHGAIRVSMRGVAARYPVLPPGEVRPLDLEQRINRCRRDHQQAPPLAYEGKALLALTAAVARQSRGLPITPAADGAADGIAAGRAIFQRRQGQLNLSCAFCHDDNWDQRLAGAPITQGHPTGYPLYRLEWQGLGSLQRRLRNCMVGMRAEPYDFESPELAELKLYLMWRARGLAVETPAIRP